MTSQRKGCSTSTGSPNRRSRRWSKPWAGQIGPWRVAGGGATLAALGQAPIVMGRESGALYVRVDDVWHPVLNLASARLIAATNANPQPVSESELGHTKRGPLLGIPGAPQLLDQPLAGAESAWAICDSDNGGSTTVVVGPAEDSSAQVLTAEQMILVATESGSPTYLLYGGRRAVVDLADPAVVWAPSLAASSRMACALPSP